MVRRASISNLKRNVVVATAHRCGYRNLLTLKNLRKTAIFFLGQENELLRCSHAYIAVGTILDLLLLLLLSSRLARIAAGPPARRRRSQDSLTCLYLHAYNSRGDAQNDSPPVGKGGWKGSRINARRERRRRDAFADSMHPSYVQAASLTAPSIFLR